MENKIIIRQSKIAELKNLIKKHQVVYISGQTGWGKTTMVLQCMSKSSLKFVHISAAEKDCCEKIKQAVDEKIKRIIIDDVHTLLGNGDFISEVIKESDLNTKFIIMGRSRLPGFLTPFYITGNLVELDENFLALTKEELNEYCLLADKVYDGITLEDILTVTKGWFIAINFFLRNNFSGEITLNEVDKGKKDIFLYLDNVLFGSFDKSLQDFLLSVAHFSTFNEEQGKIVCGGLDIKENLYKALNIGSFLEFIGQDTYRIIPLFREFLLWKRSRVWTLEYINNCYSRTALYYTLVNEVAESLKYYYLAGDMEKVTEILIANSNKHSGNGYFREVKKYYLALPEETVGKSPELISALSLIYSLSCNVEKSEFYFNMLEDFVRKTSTSDFRYKIAVSKIIYLKIALPHRNTLNIIDILKNTASTLKKESLSLQITSVTGNMPSIMNGGKDFSSWSKRDKFLYKTLKTPVMSVLGSSCAGIAELALGESLFEKNYSGNFTEELTNLNSSLFEIETTGNVQMHFAALAIIAKIFMVQGKSNMAINIVEKFLNNIDKSDYIKPNIECFLVSLHARCGDQQFTDEWFEKKSPNEYDDFFTTQRYEYITKVKAYISKGMYVEALALLNKLDIYFKSYQRIYCSMEADLLKAIIFYRQENPVWRALVLKTLIRGEEYKFINLFSQFGAAILPLLMEKYENINVTYLKRVRSCTKKQAILYPKYLRNIVTPNKMCDLTDTETVVLKLACDGLTNDEIASILCITVRTIKFHLSNIYGKLGVNNKLAAINFAVENKMF